MLITVLVETGLRVAKEALPLKWTDVFLDADPAYIYVRESKSKAGMRTVWLTNHCKEALTGWRARLGPDFSPYVFPSPRITSTHITDYKTAWRMAVRKAGLSGRRIYDLRAKLFHSRLFFIGERLSLATVSLFVEFAHIEAAVVRNEANLFCIRHERGKRGYISIDCGLTSAFR